MFKRSSIIIASIFLAGLALAEEPATAIIATQMGDALVVRGDDGKDHVEYDLLITSVFDGPVMLTSAEVVDEAGKVIGRIEGDGLKARPAARGGHPTFDRSRDRSHPGSGNGA
jgi:hypothetical protein